MTLRRERAAGTLVIAVGLFLLAGLLASWTRMARLARTVERLQSQLARLEADHARAAAQAGEPISPLLLDYRLDLPGRGEVFPAMAETDAPEYWPLAVLQVTNTAERGVAQTIAAEIPGFSRRLEQSLILGPRETRQVRIQPELLESAHRNEEIRRATLEVRVSGPDHALLFVESRPVLIHGGSEIYWGRRFANAQVAARWVTPHDAAVLELVSEARRFVPHGRMAGYSVNGDARGLERQVRAQARAVYRALQRSGISYVNSLFVMGEYVNEAQRIRLPSETLRLASANCMDVSVAFASAMENVGLQPALVIVPGHAFVGVRLGRDARELLYLDLTVLPKGTFERAEARARHFLATTPQGEVLIVDVTAARALGVLPISERTST